jgi:hypothetical protein
MAAVLSVMPSPTAPAFVMDNCFSDTVAQEIKNVSKAGRMTKSRSRRDNDLGSMDMKLLYMFGNFFKAQTRAP